VVSFASAAGQFRWLGERKAFLCQKY